MLNCQEKINNEFYCARPLRSIIFIEMSSKGKTGEEIIKELKKGSKGVIEDNFNCIKCSLYPNIKEEYEKMFKTSNSLNL
jgi:hypothetical protein